MIPGLHLQWKQQAMSLQAMTLIWCAQLNCFTPCCDAMADVHQRLSPYRLCCACKSSSGLSHNQSQFTPSHISHTSPMPLCAPCYLHRVKRDRLASPGLCGHVTQLVRRQTLEAHRLISRPHKGRHKAHVEPLTLSFFFFFFFWESHSHGPV
jgi:hypothetical protein